MAVDSGVEIVRRPSSAIGEGTLIASGAETGEALSSEAVDALRRDVVYLCDQISGGAIPDGHVDGVAEDLMTLSGELLLQPTAARLFAYYPLATALAALGMPAAAIDQVVNDGIVELDAAIEARRAGASEREWDDADLLLSLMDTRSALKGFTREGSTDLAA